MPGGKCPSRGSYSCSSPLRASARYRLVGGPVGNPVSVAEHLIPHMRRELDQHRSAGHVEQLDAGVDDRSTQSQALFRRATATKLDQDHDDGLKAVGAEAIKIVLAEFGEANVRPPQLRLHEIRVKLAKPRCQFAFDLDGIGAG